MLKEENEYLREENKNKTEIIRILSDKPKSPLSLISNIGDTPIRNDENIYQKDESSNQSNARDIKSNSNSSKTDSNSTYKDTSIHSNITSKKTKSEATDQKDLNREKKEQRNIKTTNRKEVKNSKKLVSIIGDSILNNIDGNTLSDERFNIRVKNHSGASTLDICDHVKPEIRKNPDVIIVHAGSNDLTNNIKSLENYKRILDLVRSKLPNCKLAISNVTTRKDRKGIDEKVEKFNARLWKFCEKNKVDCIDNSNLDVSCLSFKKLHLNGKGDSYLANNFLDYLVCL